MKIANRDHKKLILDILSNAFDDNQSINYIVKQDRNRAKRIRSLMDYSFEICFLYGKIFLSDNNEACALILNPLNKKTTLQSICLDIKLIFQSVGLKNIKKTINREGIIKRIQPKEPMNYLWFIGTDPTCQNNGIGGSLLRSIIDLAEGENKPIYLETSTLKNIPWYKKMGFEVYAETDLSYHLYFLKRDRKKIA